MTNKIAKVLTIVLPAVSALFAVANTWADDKMLDAKIDEKVKAAMKENEAES